MASSRSSLPASSKHFQAIAVLVLWMLWLAPVDAQNRADEVRTLLSFKEDNSVLWKTADYWNNWKESDENTCAWAGVTCTTNYTVWELDLSGWTPNSKIYPVNFTRLSNLRDLSQLDLSNNNLYAFEIGNLAGLTRLDLSFNSFGRLPEDICSLTGLTRLDLSSNGLEGPIPSCISACRRLRFLSLQENVLDGEIPSLGGLDNLQFLLLGNNSLSGPIPKEMGELSNLILVDLSNNSLNGSIPALPNLTNLVELKLDNNRFTGFEEPWFLGANSTVEHLSVSSNQLEGVIPSAITDLLNLEYLNMSSNRLSGSIPYGISRQWKNPFSLDLSQNLLTGNIPTSLLEQSLLASCPSLNLSQNLLSGSIPVLDAASYKCFEILDLSHNNLSEPIPSNLFANVPYQWIGTYLLQNNSFSGDIVDVLVAGPALVNTEELRLQNNLLTGDLSRLVNATLNGSGPYIMDLRNNKLRWSTSEAIPDPIQASLEKLPTLVELWVGGNDFSGTFLPNTCFVDVSYPILRDNFVMLDLSNSNLQGEIASAVFSSTCMPFLQYLNLSKNNISGPVPPDIFGLPELQVLDVSNNNLSGSLPPIPLNGSLINPSIYAGNPGLCGLPLGPCPVLVYPRGTGIQWWVLLAIIGGSLTIAMGSCLAATWRWRVYTRRHQQDADLINTLLERDSATLMPLRELRKATDNFAASAQIGEGGFGTVYIGKLNDGTLVAIKRSKREGSDKDKEQFLNEVRILSQVNHRHLVKLLGCCMENKTAVLVFEFVSNGTLEQHLQGKIGADHLSWKQRLHIAVQTANALNYSHTAATFPIYHRDVKSANILLDNDLNAKVADFGISKLAPLQATHVSTVAVQGTMGYIDPEYYTSYQLTDKSDVFSFGVVLLELISGKPALDFNRGGDDSSLVNLASAHIQRGDLQGLIDPALVKTYNDPDGHGRESILNVGKLATKCVDMRSKVRPTMNEVVKKLQDLLFEVSSTSEHLGESITEVDDEDNNEDGDDNPRSDGIILLSKSLSGDGSNLTIERYGRGIQMSQMSDPSFRSRSRGK